VRQADAVEIVRTLIEKDELTSMERALLAQNVHELRMRLKKVRTLLPDVDIAFNPQIRQMLIPDDLEGDTGQSIALEHAV